MDYGFTDLVNVAELRELMDGFCKDYSISYTVLDTLNNTVLFLPGSQFVPCNRENTIQCSMSGALHYTKENADALSNAKNNRKTYNLYRCDHDLMHAMFPFVFENRHIASIYIGPFLQEHEIGCKGVVCDVPVLSNSDLEMFISRSYKFLDLLVNAGKLNLKLKNYEARFIEYEKELSSNSDKLSSLDKMKKELISIFSHEMRTPLSIIKGYNELLYDGVLGPVCNEQAEALDKSLLNINKLERIVDSLQYMGNDHSDMHIYDFLPLNLSDLVETTLVHSARALKEKNLQLHTEFPDEMPVIHGDSKKLFHALSYLLDNAIKFSPQGSTISISAKQEEDRLYLSIRDNGVGIAEENIPWIFEEFYQNDSSLTRKYSGMGLGLNICQRIINCHKGNIRVESRINEGSTFHIDLPLIVSEDNVFYQAE
jgi:signal transduction histidine kinase